MEKNQVLNQDCLPVLATMPDNSVDAVITDPPYPNGMGLFPEKLIDGIAGLYLAAKKVRKHVVFFWSPVVDPPRPPPGFYETNRCIWAKPDARSRIGYELIIAWSRDWHRQPHRVWTIPILDYRTLRDLSTHPTQKPVRLLRNLVTIYTQPGETVLDPFAGTGSTGVAAKQLGRNYLLIEQNKEYTDFAQQRLTEPTKELPEPTETHEQEDEQPRKAAKAKRS